MASPVLSPRDELSEVDLAALEAVELSESPPASPTVATPPPAHLDDGPVTPPALARGKRGKGKGKGKSKVLAAASKWETSVADESTPKALKQAAAPSTQQPPSPSSSSFRSIPASSSERSLRMPSVSAESPTAADMPDTEIMLDDEPTPSVARFSDVPLETPATPSSGKALPTTSPSPKKSFLASVTGLSSPSPPRPVELSHVLPEPVCTPPAREAPKEGGRGFFGANLGFGLPSVASSSTSPGPVTKEPERSASGATWRATMNHFIGRSASSTSPNLAHDAGLADPATPTPATPSAPSRENTTSFLLSHIASPAASRDRCTSREGGGGERLRAGFDRVRSEMEGAAREIRRERSGDETAGVDGIDSGDGEAAIDWTFWGAVVQDYEEVARTQPKDLSRAIQQGIPAVIRGAIWQLMSASKSAELEDAYKALLKLTSPHEKAIAKDLSRTFPHHKFFQEGGVGGGQESLFMVVKAYSLYDQDVGYTQGLAFIVAILLLNMPDEEAFCVLVRLMESVCLRTRVALIGQYNLRSHFLADMPGLQLRLFQFDRLVEDLLPLLHTHLVRKGVKSSMFASQWFMTLFSYRFPLPLVYRVLDIVFAEGIEAIFRFAVALLRRSEEALIGMEFEAILAHLQTDVFECYRVRSPPSTPAEVTNGEKRSGILDDQTSIASAPSVASERLAGGADEHSEDGWLANRFVRDAYEARITPLMLDQYEAEYNEQLRVQNKHALEIDQLRNANRNLSFQVKNLEASLSTMNTEHVEMVRQLVMLKIEKEETENELVRYKMLYAELAHAQQDAMSIHSRRSQTSFTREG